jgi:hypothetical protein
VTSDAVVLSEDEYLELSHSSIKLRLGTTAPTIGRRKQRFLAAALDGLDTAHSGQKPSVLTAKMRARILAATRMLPKDGSTHWSRHKLAAVLGLSRDSVHRVPRSAGGGLEAAPSGALHGQRQPRL